MKTRNNTWVWLGLIFLVGVLLRYSLSKDEFLHKWDERYHALVAKNMMSAPLKPTLYQHQVLDYNYQDWSSNHIWLHKQPLPLWLISVSYSAFGISEFNTRIPSILFSSLCIIILFVLTRFLYDQKTALIASFFFSINGLVVEMTAGRIATDHYDILFLSFILISILFAYLHAKKKLTVYLLLSGVLMGMAILTKWLPALIILPIHACFLKYYDYSFKSIFRCVLISTFVGCVVFLPWQLFILSSYPQEAQWEYLHNWLHVTQPLDGQTGGFFYFINQIRINYSEIIYAPMIYLLFQLWRKRFRDFRLIAISIWIYLPLIFFSIAKTKMQGYVLFISPALFMITADFFFFIENCIKSKRRKSVQIFLYLLLVAIIILPVRYCFERTQFGFKRLEPEQYIVNYKNLSVNCERPTIVLNVKEPVDFMFYHDCVAYPHPKLDEEIKTRLQLTGWRIVKYDSVKNTVEN